MPPSPPEDAEADAPADEGGFDPERRLCPDGSCVGVLGADDRCSVCGARGGDTPAGLSPDAFGGGCMDDAEPDTGAFDAARRLCPDGSCIGVIGPGGSCATCGRAAGEA